MQVGLHILSIVSELDDAGNKVDGGSRRVEETARGSFTASGTGGVIAYRTEDENGVTESRILFPEDRQSLVITRTGAVTSEMRLAVGMTHKSEYGVLGYRFPLSVKLISLKNVLNGEGIGDIRLSYTMDIGGQRQKVSMQITVVKGEDA